MLSCPGCSGAPVRADTAYKAQPRPHIAAALARRAAVPAAIAAAGVPAERVSPERFLPEAN